MIAQRLVLTLAVALCGALSIAAGASQKRGKREPAGLELFRNGGFEEGLEGWRTLGQSPGARFELDGKVKAGGEKSLRIERTAQGGWDFLKQFVELPVDEGALRFSMRYQVEPGARLEVVFYFLDAAGETIGKGPIAVVNAGKTRKFEQEERELEIPSGAKRCGVDVILKQPGTVWVDDVSALLLGHAPPELGPLELGNPSFDEGLEWWRELPNASGTTEAARDAKVRSEGGGSLRLERASPRLYPEDGLWASVSDLGRARRVRLRFAARVGEGARAAVALQALDARGVALATARADLVEPSEDFEERELDLELPKEAARLDVYLIVRGAGTVWFDELRLGKR